MVISGWFWIKPDQHSEARSSSSQGMSIGDSNVFCYLSTDEADPLHIFVSKNLLSCTNLLQKWGA